jgi:hypothetical protein
MKRMLFLAPVLAIVSLFSVAGPAAAATPEHIGPIVDSYDFTVDCGSFEATVTGTSSTRFTVFLDAAGEVTRVAQSLRAPSDVWTNTATGKTIIVRGEFQQTYTPVPGTDQITVTIRGFRYLVNEPSYGVTVQEVGRIVYGEPTEETILFLAGKHDAADSSQVEAVFCAALA